MGGIFSFFKSTTSEPGLEQELKEGLAQPLDETPTCKDFPRLALRVQIENHRKNVEVSEAKSNQDEIGIKDAMGIIVTQLAEAFGENEVAKTAQDEAEQELTKMADKPDWSKYSNTLLHKLGGDDSRIVRVTKCFHQNILLAGIYALRTGEMKDHPFQDSRGKDSWIIKVVLKEESVEVKHIRRELLMNCKGEFRWELSINYSKDMENFESCKLSVSNVDIEKDADKREIRKCLGKLYVGDD